MCARGARGARRGNHVPLISPVSPLSRLFRDGYELANPGAESSRVPALDIDDAGAAESADEAFAGGETGDPAGRRLFDAVCRRRAPGDQVAVVHDVLFVRLELDLMDRPESVEDQLPLPPDLEDEEALASQQSAAEALHPALDLDAFRPGEEAVFLHHVLVDAIQVQDDDVSRYRGCQEH